jgi:hypothetical protein
MSGFCDVGIRYVYCSFMTSVVLDWLKQGLLLHVNWYRSFSAVLSMRSSFDTLMMIQ